MTGDDVARWTVELTEGQAFVATIEQDGADAEAWFSAPEGFGVDWPRFDTPTGTGGIETICAVAPTSGQFTLEVHATARSRVGRYTLRIEAIRSAEPHDRRCEEGLRFLRQGLDAARRDDRKVAGEALDAARDALIAAGRGRPALIAWKEGCVERRTVGRLPEAVSCFAEARDLARTLGEEGEARSLLHREGSARLALGNFDGAVARYSEARDSAASSGDQAGIATAINNLALVEKRRGRHHLALERYREAQRIWQTLGRPTNEATTLHNIGVTLSELGRFDEADDRLREAQALRADASRSLRARTLGAIGWNQHLAGRQTEAAASYRLAVRLYRDAGNLPRLQQTLAQQGTVLTAGGDHRSAARAFQESIALASDLGLRNAVVGLHASVAHLLVEREDPAAAVALLAPALPAILRLGDGDLSSAAWTILARAWRRLGDLQRSRLAFEEALAEIDRLRAEGHERGYLVHPVPIWQEHGERYVDLLVTMADTRAAEDARDAAFVAADLMRSRNLERTLFEAGIDLQADADRRLVAEEERIRSALDATETHRRELLAADPPSGAEIEALDRVLRAQHAELRAVRAAMRASHPRLEAIRDPRPVDLTSLRTALSPGTKLVRYVLGEERSFLFLLDRGGVRSWPLPARGAIEALVRRLLEGLRHGPSQYLTRQLEWNAGALANAILEPAGQHLEADRLLVVPDGALHYVPFGYLPRAEPAEPAEPAEGPPRRLHEATVIAYLPSAASLLALEQRARARGPAGLDLAVIGDPVFSADDPRLTQRPPSPSGHTRTLALLPYAGREAQAILDLVPSERQAAWLGFDATVVNVRSQALEAFRTLHVVAHARIDDRHPEVTAIGLTAFDRLGEQIDPNELRLHAVYQLRLQADLVVLSGCQTALGTQIRGEGLVSLARAFLDAGASRLLVSLWPVDDEATSILMPRFYRELWIHGKDPAQALRDAQAWLRAQSRWSSPFYWAPFVLIGA